jgi:hypothetical protein
MIRLGLVPPISSQRPARAICHSSDFLDFSREIEATRKRPTGLPPETRRRPTRTQNDDPFDAEIGTMALEILHPQVCS